MKKYFALLLALALCLSLAACASQDEKALENANALLDSCDYDGAIAAYNAIPSYNEITEKLVQAVSMKAQALADAGDYDGAISLLSDIQGYASVASLIAEMESAQDAAAAGFLYGKWINLKSDISIEFGQEGIGSYTGNGANLTVEYTNDENTVYLTLPVAANLEVTEIDGVTHLICESHNWDFVSEADYEALAPVTVEITLENWEQYFELRESRMEYINQFGDVENVSFGYGIFLRDEYVDKLAGSVYNMDIAFEIQYDVSYWAITDDNTFTDEPYPYDITETGLTSTGSVSPISYSNISQTSDLYDSICAWFSNNSYTSYGETQYASRMDNVQVLRVQGSLKLFS